jgi:hypothetical protein
MKFDQRLRKNSKAFSAANSVAATSLEDAKDCNAVRENRRSQGSADGIADGERPQRFRHLGETATHAPSVLRTVTLEIEDPWET